MQIIFSSTKSQSKNFISFSYLQHSADIENGQILNPDNSFNLPKEQDEPNESTSARKWQHFFVLLVVFMVKITVTKA